LEELVEGFEPILLNAIILWKNATNLNVLLQTLIGILQGQ
jgi:hypothetical protein